MDGAPTAEQRLADLALQWGDAGDRRAVFAECYLVMTRRVEEAILAERFQDGVWVARLLDRFAAYYFDAVDSHGGLQTVRVCPAVWREALDACADPVCHPLQALMLGINAHINHDLALALVDVLDDWPALDEEARQRRREDHELVNAVIDDTTDEVQRDVVGKWSPAAVGIDLLLGRLDEWAFGELRRVVALAGVGRRHGPRRARPHRSGPGGGRHRRAREHRGHAHPARSPRGLSSSPTHRTPEVR